MKKHVFLPIAILAVSILWIAWLFFRQLLPIPADTIIGLYHPFRDLYATDYPNGIPYKNFLITDPVRQQYPWRFLAVQTLRTLWQVPLWNPYSFSGTPLIGNFQTAFFYPLNILLLLLPFSVGWGIQVWLQPLLFAVFLYLYLRHLRIDTEASVLGAIVISLCGFSTAWFAWNTVLHTALWLPLLLLSIDRFIFSNRKRWIGMIVFSLCAAFFAGHLQTFFYLAVFCFGYTLVRLWQQGITRIKVLGISVIGVGFLLITFTQWFSTLRFILLSARDIDLTWSQEGWFIPWQNLVQFFAPDFFGNPTTLNYWGVWNYGEFVGYIGIIPLFLAIYALSFRRDKKTYFFGIACFLALLFSLPNPLAALPFILNIPFLSSAQPTRLLFVVDFSLAVLAALGLDWLKRKKTSMVIPGILCCLILGGLWVIVLQLGVTVFHQTAEHMAIARRNLYVPTSMLGGGLMLLFFIQRFKKHYQQFFVLALLLLVGFDLLRFFTKFTPFTRDTYLFPETKVITYLQEHLHNNRVMTTDSRILPPNFSIMYSLQSVEGYDPLYIRRYGELIAASERGNANIRPPFGFNRIITPHAYDTKVIDLLGVRYVLSLDDILSPKLTKVYQEGQTRIYENKAAYPRAFFVQETRIGKNKEDAIAQLMAPTVDLHRVAIVEPETSFPYHESATWTLGAAHIVSYTENTVTVEVSIPNDSQDAQGFLILTDSYYPGWKATIFPRGEDTGRETTIYRTDYNFRGVVIPAGEYRVVFSL